MENNTFRKLKIIVAEDDEASAEFLSVLLKKRASEILVATSGKETVEFCRKHSDADLILMDIQMPKMDGYETRKALKERYGESAPKMVALTGYQTEDDKHKIQDAGFEGFLGKPYSENQLIEIIKKMELRTNDKEPND